MKFPHYLLACLALLTCHNVSAHETVQNYNHVSLQVASSADVANDTMVVSMYVQEEGSKASQLSNVVNTKINWALKTLKQHKDIKVETENYSTNPVYNKNQIVAWRVKQSIQLESKNMALMSEVIGELQQQLKLNGISFDVSRDEREIQTQQLIDSALIAFSKRATQIANNLKSNAYKIVTMRVNTSNNIVRYKQRPNMMMAESAAMVSPDIAKGDKTLSVDISGTIELQ